MTTSIRKQQTKSTSAQLPKKPRVAKPAAHVALSTAKLPRKATDAKKATPARHGSKTSQVLELLKRPGGVTLKEIMKVTHWQAHSVRGFLSGTVGKKLGIPVESFKKSDGDRAYRISSK